MVFIKVILSFCLVLTLSFGTNGQKLEAKLVTPKPAPPCKLKDLYAVCHMVANPNRPSNIHGTIYFMQKVQLGRCAYDFLNIQPVIHNVPVDDGNVLHGFHIHEYGDMSGGCESMGGHYNPYNATHGSLWNPVRLRHLGDLGNVKQKKSGDINMRIVDYFSDLIGKDNIAGRGVVLHAKEDDLGTKKNDPDSLKTGNAGARLACCVIGYTTPYREDVFTLYK